MTVFVQYKIIYCQQAVQCVLNAGNRKFFAAVKIVLIYRNVVWPPTCLHNIPSGHKLRIRCNEVFAYAVEVIFFYRKRIADMRNAKPIHDSPGDNFVIRLLLSSAAASLD